MRSVAIFLLCLVAVASGFRASPRFATKATRCASLFAGSELVPVEKTNIENAAAVSGGIVGFAIGGPVVAIVLAALSNYVSKKEDSDYGAALRGFGKTVIESYNFLTTLNNKYDATGAAANSLDKFITSAEVESEGFGKFTKTVGNIGTKVQEINGEFDLIGKGKQVVIAASALSDAALEKLEELNAKVRFECPMMLYF